MCGLHIYNRIIDFLINGFGLLNKSLNKTVQLLMFLGVQTTKKPFTIVKGCRRRIYWVVGRIVSKQVCRSLLLADMVPP